jgi:hypothetical protein
MKTALDPNGELPQKEPALPNETGLPDHLKAGIEAVSGLDMDDVQVHYNSPKPIQLQALAYTQGSDIHIAPGQEKHLPHEAWHVAQQKQGRVKPTKQLKGNISINDDAGLEKEAIVMGDRALGLATNNSREFYQNDGLFQLKKTSESLSDVIQRAEMVSGGSFDFKTYTAHSRDDAEFPKVKERGAKIIIEFTPASNFGLDGKRVSLVQSVKDTMTLSKRGYGKKGEQITISEKTSEKNKQAGFEKRTTEAGWAIDQVLYNEKGELVNLDPRYAEQRMHEGEPYKQRPGGDLSKLRRDGGDLVQGMVVSAVKSGGRWTTALLSDEPTIPHTSLQTLSGRQEFEVAAMYEPSGGDLQYIGSVKWGWECNDGNVTLLAFEKGSYDWASDEFLEAGVAWNEMVL